MAAPYGNSTTDDIMTGMPALPVISLDHSGSEHESKTVQSIGDALRETGFFAIEGHGVSSSLADEAYAAAMAFFGLPETVKRAYSRPDLLGQRGYTGLAVEKAIGADVGDLKEFFQLGRDR